MSHRIATCVLVGLALCSIGLGCGSESSDARPDILATPEDELHGAATKGMLYEFRAKARKHGAAGVREELPQLLESLAGYEDQPVGDHLDTYRQIFEKLKALEASLASSPSKEQVIVAADEIGALADKLPGKANENPQVE